MSWARAIRQRRGEIDTSDLTDYISRILNDCAKPFRLGLSEDRKFQELYILRILKGVDFVPLDANDPIDGGIRVARIFTLSEERHIDYKNRVAHFGDNITREILLTEDGNWILWLYDEEKCTFVSGFWVWEEIEHWIDDDIDMGFEIFRAVRSIVGLSIQNEVQVALDRMKRFLQFIKGFDRKKKTDE